MESTSGPKGRFPQEPQVAVSNRSADIQTVLATVVETLAQVMAIKTAWAFLWTEVGLHMTTGAFDASHDFAVAACCGLPPGLEGDNRRDLCQGPDCHCQRLLRSGQLVRAVNIVECTRLQYSFRHAGDTQGLLFHASVPIISQNRPLGLINIATEQREFLTSADLQFLSAAGSQVAIALERARLYDLAETQRIRLEQELQMARAVQKSLLPTQIPRIPGFTLAADWRPVREVAGDFYDFFLLPDGRLGLLLADVSGKGAPAALYMALTRSLIRSETDRHANPSAVLAAVNRRLLVEAPNGWHGGAEGDHLFRDISEHSLPRILPPPRLSAVRVSRLVAYTRLLRAHCQAIPPCAGTPPKRLFWAPVPGGRRRIDWPRTNRSA